MSNTSKKSAPSKSRNKSTSSAESGTSNIPPDAATVYVGVDASWRGLAVQAVTKDSPGEPETALIQSGPNDFPTQQARLDYMGLEFMGALHVLSRPVGVSSTCLPLPLSIWYEGYSYGSKGQAVIDIGELGGYLRLLMWQGGYDFNLVPPTTLKKYATGKGNSAKNIMLREVYRKWGYSAEDDDQGDAYALARLGLDAARVDKTKAVQAILDKCEFVGGKSELGTWPGLYDPGYEAELKVVK